MCVLLKICNFLSTCAVMSLHYVHFCLNVFFSSSKCAVLLKMCEFGQNYIFWQNRCFLWKGYFVQKCVFVKMTILGYFLLHWVMSKCMFFLSKCMCFCQKVQFLSKWAFLSKHTFFVEFFVEICIFVTMCVFVKMYLFRQNEQFWWKCTDLVKFTFVGQKVFFCENAILYKCAFLSNDNFVLFSAILCNFVRLCAILTKSAFFVLLFQNVVLPILVLPKFWSFLYLFFLYLRLLFLFILFLSLPSFGLPIFAHPIFVTSYIWSSYFWSSYFRSFLYLSLPIFGLPIFGFPIFALPIFVTSYIWSSYFWSSYVCVPINASSYNCSFLGPVLPVKWGGTFFWTMSLNMFTDETLDWML